MAIVDLCCVCRAGVPWNGAHCPCTCHHTYYVNGWQRSPGVAERQPPPEPSTGDIQKLVIADIEARRQFGINKYGTPLQANNGRDALMDLYQELLDAVCYVRQLIEERDETGR